MKVGDIIKIKNPGLPFQAHIRYKITNVLKTVVHCRVVEKQNGEYVDSHYGEDYKGIRKSLISLA